MNHSKIYSHNIHDKLHLFKKGCLLDVLQNRTLHFGGSKCLFTCIVLNIKIEVILTVLRIN